MSNILKVKRGATIPTVENLAQFELGYCTGDGLLYINNGGEIEEIGNAIKAHASTHATGGTDPITPNSIGAATTSHTHDLRYYTETETNDLLDEKTDKIIPSAEGNLAGLDEDGNLLDSGINPAGVYRRIPTPGVVNIKDYVLGLACSGCGDAGPDTTGFPLTSMFWNFIVHYSTAGRIVLEAIQAGAALNRYYCINTDGNWSSWYKLTVTAV